MNTQKLALPPLSNSTKISLFVYSLGIVIKIGKYFSVISICLTLFNLFMAVNEFAGNNISFGILNSMFVVGGLVFDAQSHVVGWLHKSG